MMLQEFSLNFIQNQTVKLLPFHLQEASNYSEMKCLILTTVLERRRVKL